MSRGVYIVIEGGEGCGKDTQVERLRERFGDRAVFTREPGGTSLGKTLRDILLHRSHGNIAHSTELFLFLADRAEHAAQVVLPSLAEGKNIISNRSWVSFIAYQIYGREQFDWRPSVEDCVKKIFEHCPIDLAIILDQPPEIGFARMQAAGRKLDAIEQMPLKAHERIREGFLAAAKTLPNAVVIDANRPVDAVWKDVEQAVASAL